MTGIRTACKCLLGLLIGCSMLPSSSAQVMIMGHGNAGVTGVGQHRIVGFQPANGMAGMSSGNRLYGNGASFGQPIGGFSGLNSASMMGFQTVNSGALGHAGIYGAPMNFGAMNTGLVTTGSQYGRMIRYRYRVPVYGKVSSCSSPVSSCNSCGP